MRTDKIGLLAAAALGGLLLCGFNATAQQTNAPAGHPKKGLLSVDARMEHLDQLLNLTDEEKPKVRAAMEVQVSESRGLRDLPQEERREKRRSIEEAFGKSMKEILTPSQFETWLGSVKKGKRPPVDAAPKPPGTNN
jgi:Spy/CpxP family protein refolding chaperone